MNCHAFRLLMCLRKKPNLVWYGGQSMKNNFQLLSILQEQLGIFNNHIETKITFSIARFLAKSLLMLARCKELGFACFVYQELARCLLCRYWNKERSRGYGGS